MRSSAVPVLALASLFWGLIALMTNTASAADFPAPREGDWTARDFHFHTGDVMAALRLHYTTIGNPSGEPVLILHGTAEAGGRQIPQPQFRRRIVRPRPAAGCGKYFIILPDALGAGKSSKPSDGLRMAISRL